MPEITPVYIEKNECEPFTLFDLGVQCLTISEPTSSTSNDGILSLIITGGTTPYTILWSNGQVGSTLYNLPAGSYEVTVIDYYGDYTANTTCSLFAPTATPTPTITPTITPSPSPVWPNLCLIVTYGTTTYGPYQFTPSGSQNGKPTWNYTSGSTIYNIVWTVSPTINRWVIQGWNILGGNLVSNVNTNIPDSGWVEVGAANNPIITMTQGTCPTILPLFTTVKKTNNSCSQNINCNGSITILTSGGVPPYTYSINAGANFQSSNLFESLCPQTYTVITKDSSGTTVTNLVSILSDSTLTTYTISAVNTGVETTTPGSKIAYWKINVSPAIPVGTTINFTLNITSAQYINQPGSGIITSTSKVYKNGTLQTAPIPTSSTNIVDRANCSPYQTSITNKTEIYNLSLIANDTITGTSTSLLSITTPEVGQNGCITLLEQDINVFTSQATTNGCNCCSVNNDPSSKGGVFDHTLTAGSSGSSGGGGGGGTQPDYIINIPSLPLTQSVGFTTGNIVVSNAPVTIKLKAYGGDDFGSQSKGSIIIDGIGFYETPIASQYQTTEQSIILPNTGTYNVSALYGTFQNSLGSIIGNYVTLT